jgi:hypothetical protein
MPTTDTGIGNSERTSHTIPQNITKANSKVEMAKGRMEAKPSMPELERA